MLCARCGRWLKRTWSDQRSKRFIVIFNVILGLCGCLLICVGLWMLICRDSLFYGVLLTENNTDPMIVIDGLTMAVISIGIIVSMVSFVGACGACTECICFMGFHAVLVLCCVAAQIVFAIVAASLRSTVNSNMAASLQHQIRYQYNVSGTRIVNASSLTYRLTSAWDQLQQQLECCGSVGPSDYHYSSWFNHTPDSDGSFVPMSCCAKSQLESQAYNCQFEAVAVLHSEMSHHEPHIVRTQGCYDAILNMVDNYSSLFAFLITAVDIVLIVDVIYCCLLIRITRRKQSDYTWCDEEAY